MLLHEVISRSEHFASVTAETLLSKTQSIHEFVESDEYVLYEVFKSV